MRAFPHYILIFLSAFFFQGCNLLSAAGIGSQGQPVKEIGAHLNDTSISSPIHIDHSQWDKLLKEYVDKNGLVNYKGFKNDGDKLEAYLNMLSENAPDESWSVQELLAYYINLYNAATVKLIVDNYPVKSIKDINGAWTKGRVQVGNKKLSLGGIENGILRKMKEPRIHFAINCASISCPKLMEEAYTANKINAQLDRAAKEFINSDKNFISEDEVKLSSIFDWYKNDFSVDGNQNVIGFINRFSDVKINPNARVEFKNYNWDLNEKK